MVLAEKSTSEEDCCPYKMARISRLDCPCARRLPCRPVFTNPHLAIPISSNIFLIKSFKGIQNLIPETMARP